VRYIAAGICKLAADQAGNSNYNPAPQVTRNVTVEKANQTITFTRPASPKTFNDMDVLVASSSSGLTVSFSSLTTSVCTVAGTMVFYTGSAGTCTVAADQAGDGNYNPATRVTHDVTVDKANQTITFTQPTSPVTYSVPNGTDTLSATSTSGLTVSFSSLDMSVCTVSGTTVRYIAAGTCKLAADQAGNGNYNPAATVNLSVTVDKANQTITFIQPTSPVTYSVPNKTDTLSATSSSGLTVTFSSLTTSVCTVSATTVRYSAAGTCTLAADQPGNSNYNPATRVTRDVTVDQASQTITFTPPASPVSFNTGAPLMASSSSGLTVTFSSLTTSVCTVSGTMVFYTGSVGRCTVAADQAGDANYLAATQVTHDVKVDPANQTITFTQPSSAAPNTTASLMATSSSGLVVTFSSLTTSVCTVSGTTVSYLANGLCTLAANQAGNANYNPAPQVTRDVTVGNSVLIVAASSYVSDVRSQLLSQGFPVVDIFNAATGTPTLSQLQPYTAVLVFSDACFQNPTGLGNVVADYFDGGGRVVATTFVFVPSFTCGYLGGRFSSYALMSATHQLNSTSSLGPIHEPGSPLLAGVSTLTAAAAYRQIGSPINGGIVVAAWADGTPLIVRGTKNGRNRVDLNFYPPSSAIRSDFVSGHNAIILANALRF
jgi:hypothetical protein